MGIFLVIVLPTIGGLACIAGTACIISVVIYCIYRITNHKANTRGAPVVQPQQVALHPVYAGPTPAAPPGGMVPGQPGTQPDGTVLEKTAATHYGTVQGQPAFIGSPYMQPASTALPVPEHKDKPSSPSSQQQQDAPPSYDVATGGEP